MASCFKNKIRSGCHLKPLYLKTLQMNPPEQQDRLPAQILCNWFITLIAVAVRSISSQYEVILIIAAARMRRLGVSAQACDFTDILSG